MTVLDYGLAQTATVLEQAFSDYFVKLPATAATLVEMARHDSVDLAASRVWWCAGQPAGVLLHAGRGWSGRLAGMGVIPAARRHGLGARMVETWITECRQHGLRSLGLEVIGANSGARRLYERFGFRSVQRLAGWTAKPARAATDSPAPEAVDPRAVARHLAQRDPAGVLPWQIAAESVAQLGPPCTAWRLGSAEAVVSDLAAPSVAIRGLTWEERTGPLDAARVLQALMRRHPDRDWRAPAIFPESWSPVFEHAGWAPSPLDQWQMVLHLGT